MRFVLTYGFSCMLIFLLLYIASWLGFGVTAICNAYFDHMNREAQICVTMRTCTRNQYDISAYIPSDFTDNGEAGDDVQGEVVWSSIGVESYGPQKRLSKKRSVNNRRTRSVQKSIISNQHNIEHAAITHRDAPFSLPLPLGSFWLSSRFGPRPRANGSAGFHHGIDLAANRGTSVYAARSGVVIYAGYNSGYGKNVVIKHGSRFRTRYAHLDKIFISTGDTVVRGESIGAVGATGHIRTKGGDGSHLHFEVYYQGKRVDPLQFLPNFVS
jgi:murein DD-endopeptidase MepM/ murein hydrolase activator NlpD